MEIFIHSNANPQKQQDKKRKIRKMIKTEAEQKFILKTMHIPCREPPPKIKLS